MRLAPIPTPVITGPRNSGGISFRAVLGTVTAELLEARNDAETAATAAATARTGAETAETNAETAQGLAEDARDAAEAAQAAAEAVGSTNDSIIAGRINDSASATSAALTASTAEQAVGRMSRSKHAPALGLYFPEAEGGGNAASAATNDAAFAAAMAAAVAGGGRLYAEGAYSLSSTFVITGPADLSLATLTGNASPLVKVGDGATVLSRATVYIGDVVRLAKAWGLSPGPGAGVIGTDVGVRIDDTRTCTIHIKHVQNFSVGVDIADDAGSLYNRYFIGHLDNNAINLRAATTGAGGAANESQFHGGRYSHNSGEGTNVAGTRHIAFLAGASSGPNNMQLFGGSIEGNVAEYHVECAGGYNQFIGMRWEATTPKVLFTSASAQRNCIRGGYGAESIVVTQTSSASKNTLDAPGSKYRTASAAGTDGVFVVQNTSSSDQPAWTILDVTGDPFGSGGTAPSATYCVTLTAQHLRGKRTADANPRVDLDFNNGKIGFGSGPSAITQFIRQEGAALLGFQGTGICASTDATYDIGQAAANRFRHAYLSGDIKGGGVVKSGAGATGSRPGAGAAGAGAMWFDTTLGKPIWSTGSAWVDASGASV
ncbi:hypothetical protein [Nocardioides aquiterrae]|uniref:Pectate lyase superfamily protein domain-containing protein n=1 Tax=Nocardioides aquiterrae TaxID=203799 RepID=A0ABN1UJI9_9ACTN